MITETHYIDCDVLEKITRQSPPAATAGACSQAEMKKNQRRWGDGGREGWMGGWVDMWVDGWMGGWVVDTTGSPAGNYQDGGKKHLLVALV